MMTFYLIDDYEGKNFIGEEVRIDKGTILSTDMDEEYICFEDVPICGVDSNRARTKFVWADKGDYERRLFLERKIVLDYRVKTWEIQIPVYDENTGKIIRYDTLVMRGRFSPFEVKYIKENFSDLIDPSESGIRFNSKFYHGSDLEDLEKLGLYLDRNY